MSRNIFIPGALTLFTLGGAFTSIGTNLGSASLAQKADSNPNLTNIYFGVDACRQCHGLEKSIANKIVPPEKALFYLGTEMSTWDQHDKHKDATKVLEGERGRQMGKILGYNVAEDQRCVSCHGVVIPKGAEFDAESFGKPEQRAASGVSCVVCHGAYQEWVNAHGGTIIAKKGQGWKDYSQVKKQSDFGLNNLWDPATRATMCMSCHVGNHKDGKVVTHEMYAAGHPPLPGFEIVAFADAMPRHWRTFTEKVAANDATAKDFQERFKKNQGFDAEHDSLEQSRMLVIAAVVAFRESMQLIVDEAKAEPNHWPELASFDCYACHHDLKKNSWRQKRGYTGKPGRPVFRPWSLALLELGLLHLEGTGQAKEFRTQLDKGVKDLQKVLDAQPFGDHTQVAQAAGQLAAWADSMIRALDKAPFDRATCAKALPLLAELAKKHTPDFDSARQLAWAFRSLLCDLEGSKKLETAEWQKSLRLLDEQLNLRLIEGRIPIIPEYLNSTLARVADYDPEPFAALMASLAAQYQKSVRKR
jgi:Cytochrome c554 and c-prime